RSLAADPEGAGAVLLTSGAGLRAVGRVQRSLPVRLRTGTGAVHNDDDPRLVRERGTKVALERVLAGEKPAIIAGLGMRDAAAFCVGEPPALPGTGASSAVFALAAFADQRSRGVVAAVEQASASAVLFDASNVAVTRKARR